MLSSCALHVELMWNFSLLIVNMCGCVQNYSSVEGHFQSCFSSLLTVFNVTYAYLMISLSVEIKHKVVLHLWHQISLIFQIYLQTVDTEVTSVSGRKTCNPAKKSHSVTNFLQHCHISKILTKHNINKWTMLTSSKHWLVINIPS